MLISSQQKILSLHLEENLDEHSKKGNSIRDTFTAQNIRSNEIKKDYPGLPGIVLFFKSFVQALFLPPAFQLGNTHREKRNQKPGDSHFFHFPFYKLLHLPGCKIRPCKLTIAVTMAAIHQAFASVGITATALLVFF